MKGFSLKYIFAFHLLVSVCFLTEARETKILKTIDPDFFKTAEARSIGDRVIAYQRVTGGWPKNTDMARELTENELDSLAKERSRVDDSTTDNDATTTPIAYLARLYSATGEKKYAESVKKGVEYLLSGQYDNGGWPQFWPGPQGYQIHITFNDGSMSNILTMLRDISLGEVPFGGDVIDETTRHKAAEAFKKGIECILACQIIKDGRPTVWCQQHDCESYQPAAARTYELPSYCTQESAQIVQLLMSVPNPDERIVASVKGAMEWFDNHKLNGYRYERVKDPATGKFRATLTADPEAGPIWGRFYDLEEEKVFVCDRDGVPRRSLDEIGEERRNGYSWYNDHPALLLPEYQKWLETICGRCSR